MENEFENKVAKAMKKFVGKGVKITISGIIESKFYMKNLKYEIEEGILVIEDGDDAYLDVDIDDVGDKEFLENLEFCKIIYGEELSDIKSNFKKICSV